MTTKIDYKKELEAASRGMIMIHDPELLIKLIVRMIVGKVQIKHAGMIVYDADRDCFVLNISKGETGFKIPAGFARFDNNHPIIALFNKKEYRTLVLNRNAIVTQDINKLIWQESVMREGSGKKELLYKVADQMHMIGAVACVPAYYSDKLQAVLLLGARNDGDKFDQQELDFFAALASDAAMAIRNAQLFIEAKREAEKTRDLFFRTTLVLASAIEIKDKYTHGHTERVTNYAVMIAQRMVENGSANFDQKFLENVHISSLLHDIGKIGVPEVILNKPGQLTHEEFEIMKRHTTNGVEILKPLLELKDALDGVKSHHERYDGGGYPEGLKGEQIPMVAAIIAVADTYDAMITDRPYRKGMSKEEAVAEIKSNILKQFHYQPAQALIELYELGKV
ncbi:MAG: HD-GYP domain-containing protein [Candidatus Omnitrophica bacterium]|nr:HD-GYP domain-containing protein [Candidatus Omnitrophota bacterium]